MADASRRTKPQRVSRSLSPQPPASLKICNQSIACQSDQKSIQKTGLIYDAKMLQHDNPVDESHPECPDRIHLPYLHLQHTHTFSRCLSLSIVSLRKRDIERVHTHAHLQLMKSTARI